jgi:hypothetical protein
LNINSALKKYPALNTSFNEEAGEIVHKHYWNIGIAADTDRGLLILLIVHVAPFISSDVNLPSRAFTASSLISSEIWFISACC